MMFKEEESGFFAGIAAALHTKTNKVAVVNGNRLPVQRLTTSTAYVRCQIMPTRHYGTTAEIIELPAYSGTDVTGADVGGNYIGAFADQATGKGCRRGSVSQRVLTSCW